jgi:thiol-disulfide isomerase/thioredoxin
MTDPDPGVGPTMTTGVTILIAAVACALAFGLWRAATDGRFRGTHRVGTGADEPTREDPASRRADSDLSLRADEPTRPALGVEVGELGERATLLQFSSAFCAPCRATRRVLGDIAAAVPGVAHLELDAEERLELTRSLGIARTPTTLVLDAGGVEVARASGAPRKEQVLAALAPVLDASTSQHTDGPSA